MESKKVEARLLELVDEFAGGRPTVFANLAGIPPSTFSGYLKGRTPHVDHLIRMQVRFGVSVDWILAGTGEKRRTIVEKDVQQHPNDESMEPEGCGDSVVSRLKVAREELGLTQGELALALGVSPSSVSKMENSKKQIDCYSLLEMRKKFGVDINWILTGETRTRAERLQVVDYIHRWLKEISREEPGREVWFEFEVKDKFPLFAEWLKGER